MNSGDLPPNLPAYAEKKRKKKRKQDGSEEIHHETEGSKKRVSFTDEKDNTEVLETRKHQAQKLANDLYILAQNIMKSSESVSEANEPASALKYVEERLSRLNLESNPLLGSYLGDNFAELKQVKGQRRRKTLISEASKQIRPIYDEVEIRVVLERLFSCEDSDLMSEIYFEPFRLVEVSLPNGRENIGDLLAELIIQIGKEDEPDPSSFDSIVQKVMAFISPQQLEPAPLISIESSAEAFETEYMLSDQNLDTFATFVRKDIIEEFRRVKKKYHSLYFSFVQSSGYGKTRMLIEAGKNRLNTVYACLRPKESTGYPVSNEFVKALLTRCKDEELLMYFLSTVYMTAFNYLGCGEIGTCAGPFPGFPLHRLAMPNRDDLGLPKFSEFWSEVIRNFDQHFLNKNTRSKVIAQVKFYQANYWSCQNRDLPGYVQSNTHLLPSELILVLDEARFLLDGAVSSSKFRLLRSAHKKMESSHFVLVLVDTTSTISNFCPPFRHDPSARPTREFTLLPVFYAILTYNSVCIEAQDPNDRLQTLLELFSKGRPLWATCTSLANSDLSIEDIFNAILYAMSKLSNQPLLTLKDNYFGTLAAMAIRFGLWGIMDHSYATMLVSSYMATALHFGEDRLRMFVHYVPEPILSEAACRLLHDFGRDKPYTEIIQHPAKSLVDGLEAFEASMISGFIDVGNVGEAVYRIVVSLIHDMIHFKSASKGQVMLFSEPITFSKFMDELITPEYKDLYKKTYKSPCLNQNDPMIKKMRSEGLVCFTTFEVIEYENNLKLTQELLKRAYEHRFAFIGSDNQKGCDLIIPVKMNDCYGASINQVKTYFEQSTDQVGRFAAAGPNLTPQSCFKVHELEYYMSVYVELNFSGEIKTIKEETSVHAAAHFQKYGNHAVVLDFSTIECLQGPIAERLASLQRQRVDLVNKKGNLANLKRMDPHRYGGYEIPPADGAPAAVAGAPDAGAPVAGADAPDA